MEAEPLAFLERLVSTPGVSGMEGPVQAVVAEYAKSFGANVRSDLHGNLILSTNEAAHTRLLYAGHADQIGLIVSYIDDRGYLYVQTVGGWDPQQLVGQQVVIWTEQGPLSGVISRKAIHLLDESERKKVVEIKNLFIDIGVESREQAELLVRVGDTITVRLGMTHLKNSLVCGPALDNRTGLWVVVEGMRRAILSGNLACALHVASTVQEEIGLRGARTAAYSVEPHVALAVDVTHATDCPDVDSKQQGAVSLGKGPVIVRGPNMTPMVSETLIRQATRYNVFHQITALGRAAPNDSNELQVSRGGVATGLVAIPNRYMHSAVEVVSLEDLEAAADLLMWFSLSVRSPDQFLPQF